MTAAREQRQYQRSPIMRTAQLSTPQLAPLACTIIDYCQKGVMVKLTDANISALPSLLHQSVTLKFVAEQNNNRIHRFTGKVVRATPPNSFGIEVARFHPDTFQELSRSSTTPATSDKALSVLNKTQLDDLLRICKKQFIPFIQDALSAFFERLDAAFAVASTGALNLDERWAFNSAPTVMKAQHDVVIHAFLRSDYERQTVQAPTHFGAEASDAGQLSLVDVDDFEDWLNLAQAIQMLESAFNTELLDFTARFASLNPQYNSIQSNPYCPFTLLSTLRDVIAEQDLTTNSRALLYKTFQLVLMERLADFYSGLLAALPKRATPASKRSDPIETASKPESRPVSQEGEDIGTLSYKLDNIMRHLDMSQAEPHRHVPNMSPSQSGAMSPTQNESSQNHLDTAYSRLAQSLSRGIPSITASQTPDNYFASPERSMMQTTTRLQSQLQQLRDEQTGRPTPAPQSEYEQHQLLENILKSLDQLRAQPEHDASTFKQRLFTALPELAHSEIQTERHVQAVELFDALISQPLANAIEDSDIVALLKKLELPLLKLALTDTHFLGSDTHAARQTVNLFECYHIAADDNGKVFDPELLNLLNGLANRVVDRFESRPDVFEEVNTVLQKLLVPLQEARQTKLMQHLLNAEANEKIYLVREQLEQFMSTRLDVPTIALEFIQQVWQRHLQLICLREHCEHADFKRALSVLATLLVALSDQKPLPAPDRSKLLQAITPGIKAVLLYPTLIQDWTLALDAALNGSTEITYARYPITTPALTDSLIENDEVKLLRLADWISLRRNGQPVPFQLAWTNSAGSRFLFINRSATVKYSIDRATLMRSFESGDALPLGTLNIPFMQRSAHSVMLNAYERLYQQAIHDTESGLLNRKGLMNLLDKLFVPGLHEIQSGVLCLLVFDQLKIIHQSCDPSEAEASLHALIDAMQEELRSDDSYARLGEDTFVILFRERPVEEAHAIILDILARIAEHRVICESKRFAIAVNAGLAEVSAVESPSALLKNAASACVAAKSRGINTVHIHQTDSAALSDEEALFEWAGLIDKALSDNLLFLRCQKIQPIQSDGGLLPHYEILLGLDASLNTNPLGFVRAAEKWNRSQDLDLWVIRTSFAWLAQNADKLDGISGFSINLSGLSLISQTILDHITTALAAPNFPVDKVIFEVTETAAIHHLAAAQDFIAQVKSLGCRVSLDDFGSGYSSFAYLKNLDVDYLKIDGAFVRDLLKDKADQAMVKSMHDVGHALGLKTIAEYVENAEIMDKLHEIGVNYAQGWHIAKPIPLNTLTLP
jgi:diguanylate cyclase (GGDEF)-like protein